MRRLPPSVLQALARQALAGRRESRSLVIYGAQTRRSYPAPRVPRPPGLGPEKDSAVAAPSSQRLAESEVRSAGQAGYSGEWPNSTLQRDEIDCFGLLSARFYHN